MSCMLMISSENILTFKITIIQSIYKCIWILNKTADHAFLFPSDIIQFTSNFGSISNLTLRALAKIISIPDEK